MPYMKSMNQKDPGLFIFLIDKSRSMNDPWPKNQNTRKIDALVDVLNNTINEIAFRCVKGEGMISDRCFIAMIGYMGDSVFSAWEGVLANQDIISISEIAANPKEMKPVSLKYQDSKGNSMVFEDEVPVWVSATTQGGTPMKEAMQHVLKISESWVTHYRTSFPPIIVHITDGEPTSGDPFPYAKAIKQLNTDDGEILMVNIYLPTKENDDLEIVFPSDRKELPDDDAAQLLFEMSSVIPEEMLPIARQIGLEINSKSRLMVMNSDIINIIKLVQFASIGTMDR